MHCRGAGAPLDHGGGQRPEDSSGGFFFFFPVLMEGSLKQGNGREYILVNSVEKQISRKTGEDHIIP